MRKNLIVLWFVVLVLMLLSSCAFNLFSNLELRNLLSTGTTEQKIKAAKEALSGGNYDAAIALSTAVINRELNLNLTIEDFERLLESTSVVHQLSQALQGATPTKDLLEAVRILVEAVACKTKKDLASFSEDVYDLMEELGIFDARLKTIPKGNSNFWGEFETSAGTIVSVLSEFFDNRNALKLLTGGYHFIAMNTNEDRNFSAMICVFYDICYMFNLLLDVDNDGNVTDEAFVKNVINDPDSIVELSQEATSGLYNDSFACDEFVWALNVLEDAFDILGIEASFPAINSATLSQKQKIYDVLILF
ncbi:hypothetical protein [Pseudothermotoga sp.]|nr:hypothetical protein [Pseudothermotoga sp.]MDW8140076.1 hypothetical protein [Pseudothermotoga sp.]